jgi:hypothetical protein
MAALAERFPIPDIDLMDVMTGAQCLADHSQCRVFVAYTDRIVPRWGFLAAGNDDIALAVRA